MGRGVAQLCTASEDAVLWAVGCFAFPRVQVRVLSGWEGIRLNYTGSGGNLVRAYLGLFLSQSAFKMLLKLLLVFSRDTLIERVERNGVSSVHLETQLGQDWLEESTVPQGRCCRVAGGRMPRPFLCAHPPQPPLSALLLGKEHSGLLSCSMIFSFEVFSSTVRAFLRTEELWRGGGCCLRERRRLPPERWAFHAVTFQPRGLQNFTTQGFSASSLSDRAANWSPASSLSPAF